MEQLLVLKIGGNVLDNPAELNSFLSDLAEIKTPTLLVHGGGKIATSIASRLGVETQMVNGRRITDAASLEVVVMVYAGLINKQIVAALNAKGRKAVGLSGADGSLIVAHKRQHPSIDFGFVGDIDAVDSTLLLQQVKAGYLPVMSPICADQSGQLLNTNADTIAQSLATALSQHFEVTLCYCFEKAGVLQDVNDDASVLPRILVSEIEQLIADGVLTEGMLPKIQNAAEAITSGVTKVRITSSKAFGVPTSGTTIQA